MHIYGIEVRDGELEKIHLACKAKLHGGVRMCLS